MEDAKSKYTKDVQVLEQNIKKFNEMLDPLVDPISGDVLCWVRRPTQKEWEDLIPQELLEYTNIEDVPQDVAKKYRDYQFDMMAQLISHPKKDAAWWKANSTLVFQELFQAHLADVYRKLGVMAENF